MNWNWPWFILETNYKSSRSFKRQEEVRSRFGRRREVDLFWLIFVFFFLFWRKAKNILRFLIKFRTDSRPSKSSLCHSNYTWKWFISWGLHSFHRYSYTMYISMKSQFQLNAILNIIEMNGKQLTIMEIWHRLQLCGAGANASQDKMLSILDDNWPTTAERKR